MDRLGNAFIDETELRVVVDQPVLAGQHKALAALRLCVCDSAFEQPASKALLPIRRKGVHPEDHLPRPVFVMKRRIGVHFVRQIGQIAGVGLRDHILVGPFDDGRLPVGIVDMADIHAEDANVLAAGHGKDISGIGLEFHETPFVSHVGKKGTGMLLVPGMVFTIEPMVNMGTCEVCVDDEDGWTVYTEDGKPSAQWEITVAVTETGHEVLTY